MFYAFFLANRTNKMKHHFKYLTAASLFMGGVCASHAAPYEGTIYWTSQDNQPGDRMDNQTAFSPDGNPDNRFATPEDVNWENCDVVFDAQYTGDGSGTSSSQGVNQIRGPQNDLIIKSFTVTDNWNGSIDNNKNALWLNGWDSDPGRKILLTVKEDVNVYSAIGGNNQPQYWGLSARNVNIDIANDGRVERGVRFTGLSSLTTSGDFTVIKSGNVHMANVKYGTDPSDFGGITIGNNMTMTDIGEFSASGSSKFEVKKNFSITNAQYIRLDSIRFTVSSGGEQINDQVSGGIFVGGNVNVDSALEFNTNSAATFNVKGDVTLKNIGTMSNEGQYSGGIHLFNTGEYYGKSVGGIDVGGNFTIENSRLDAHSAGFLKVGGDFVMKSLPSTASGIAMGSIGRNGDTVYGGIEIGRNFQAVSMGGIDMTFHGYFKVGGDLDLSDSSILGWFGGAVEIAGSVKSTGGVNLQFDAVDHISVGKNFGLNNLLESRETDYVKVGGDFSMAAGSEVRSFSKGGVNGGAASETNVGFQINGSLNMEDGARFGVFFYDTYAKDSFMSANGINGIGVFYLSKEKIQGNTDTFSNTLVLTNTKDAEFLGSVHQYYHQGEATLPQMRMNIIMNGSAKQVLRMDNVAQWYGKVTVNSGTFLLTKDNTNTSSVDVEVNAGGSFGSSEFETANINSLNINGGAIVAYGWDEWSGYTNAVNVDGEIKIGDAGMSILFDGEGAEDIFVDNFITWTSVYDDNNRKVFEDAFADGKIRLFDSSGREYEIKDLSADGWKLAFTFGQQIVPEPATVATILGAVALGFTAYRRRK